MSDQYVMKILGTATVLIEGAAVYLEAYDPETARDSRDVRVTTELAKARRFADAGEVLTLWNTPSTRVTTRTDGRQNKPLTAFTIQPERIE